MTVSPLTKDELIATLRRSSLPTLLVEGNSDSEVYRYLESKFEGVRIDILVCGGRMTLFEVYKERAQFSDKKVFFLADQDMFIFSGIPSEYSDVIFTDGYSIENDLYMGSRLESLLEANEKPRLKKLISRVSIWFGIEVDRYSKGKAFVISHNPKAICDERFEFRVQFYYCAAGHKACKEIIIDIQKSYKRKLRGKQLLQSLLWVLSNSTRRSKYSLSNLYELSLKMTKNRVIHKKICEISERFTG